MGETIGCGIIDSGCNKTVAGQDWIDLYMDTLSSRDKNAVTETISHASFRFGDGPIVISSRLVTLPVYVGSTFADLSVYIVPCDIPLLISRESLKRAEAKLDFTSDKINMFGCDIKMFMTNSGHYCINLSRQMDDPLSIHNRVFFTSPLCGNDPNCDKQVLKIHNQYAHPDADRLKKFLSRAGHENDTALMEMVDKVTNSCKTCKKYKPAPPRPAVGFPLATTFNEVVAMDLKQINSELVLHMIDHVTRYSSACVIKSKHKEVVVKAIMENWVRIFGPPTKFLSDNGGEFINQELIELAEKFNIFIKTTAAESPWSNGLCERHNAILADNVYRILEENKIPLQLAIHWACVAKNTLMNVYGFSPNQLVFCKNPDLPSTHVNKIPANSNPETVSKYIADNLTAMHAAREAHIAQETSERLRRALNRKTRTIKFFEMGKSVYYKRDDSKAWHGPAKVVGKDSQNYLLKHACAWWFDNPCAPLSYTGH